MSCSNLLRAAYFRAAYFRAALVFVFTLIATLTISAQAQAAPSPSLSAESLRKPDGTLNLTTGASGAIDLQGWNVALDSKRGPVLSPVSAPSASDAGNTWYPLPHDGLSGNVLALAVWGSEMYVGGSFTSTGDAAVTDLNHIAKFDGTNWSALPNDGLDGDVRALAVFNNVLYVGGDFTQTADTTVTDLNNIAKFDPDANGGLGAWSGMPDGGLNGGVFALAVLDSKLYVGGLFTQSPDGDATNLNRIAKFDGIDWSSMPNNGLNGGVYALEVWTNDLFVGGGFTQTADAGVTNLNNIARFRPYANSGAGAWFALPHDGLNSSVTALAAVGNRLYVGGFFTATADSSVALNYIARFNPAAMGGVGVWFDLPNSGLNDGVRALAISGRYMYVGGDFTKTNDNILTLNKIARFERDPDGSPGAWSALPNNGLDASVYALAITLPPVADEPTLFVGGFFSQTADTNVVLNHIGNFTLASTQSSPTFIVNSDADTDDGLCDVAAQGHGNEDCTLREAINAANAYHAPETIHFDTDHTITLSSALPMLADDLTIDGETHRVILDGNNLYRILHVGPGSLVLVVGHLTFRNGVGDTDLTWGKSGGAIYNDGGYMTVRSSTFQNNHAEAYGGAILDDGTTTISNSTFADNSADANGGAISSTFMTVINSTFSGNSAPAGAAIQADNTLTLKNSILANSTGPDCFAGSTADSFNNVIESTGASACSLMNGFDGNKIGFDPNLGALADNGGITETFALLAGSIAIDAGDNIICSLEPVSNLDQRDAARPADGDGNFSKVCDIGSFEAAQNTSCLAKPGKPTLKKPVDNGTVTTGKVKFKWKRKTCTTTVKVMVKSEATGKVVFKKTVTGNKATTPNALPAGDYIWFVTAINHIGKTNSNTSQFSK